MITVPPPGGGMITLFWQVPLDSLQKTPPEKWWKNTYLALFFMFFSVSFHWSHNSCPMVTTLYPKTNLMFLNTFLMFICCQNYFFVLSQTQNETFSPKNAKKREEFLPYFWLFSVQKIHFVPVRARKNDFDSI